MDLLPNHGLLRKQGAKMTKESIYKGNIKVVAEDLMCFPVAVGSLAPLSCGVYDPYALSDPDPTPVETVSISEWQRRREEQFFRISRSLKG